MTRRSLFLLLSLLCVHFSMNGQYVYHDVIPNLFINDTQYTIDLNQDGVDDFILHNANVGAPQYNWTDNVSPIDTNQVVCDVNGPLVLHTNDTVSVNSSWGTANQLMLYMSMQYVSGNWNNTTGIQYVGVRYAANNSWHYGWIRLQAGVQMMVYDWGYNATADSSIIAGNGIDVGIAAHEWQPASVFASGKEVTINLAQQTQPAVFKLYNANGQLVVHQQIAQSKTSLNCAAFPTGIYFAEVYCDEKVFSQKLVLAEQ